MKKQEQESNILVAIRVRPLNIKQSNSGEFDIVRIQDNLMIVLDPIEKEFELENKKMLDVLHRSKEQRYAFDKIYRQQKSDVIYTETVQPLIATVLSGKNATVFAYGPTGTGKTYTMLGNQETYGLNVLAVENVFEKIREDEEFDYNVTITYVEIYNEMIRDLLVLNSGYLELRDDNERGITISGVTEFKAESTQQVMNLLHMGNKRRTTEATNANQTSSRSHAVFQINVSKTSKVKGTSVETLSGKLSLIDLAGSQRGTVTQNRGIRLMEGAKINRSLLALANCINALGDKNKKGFFVPYRDSKLTRLLKDSLGGNSRTVMIVNISPASSQFQETINTLKYANRAKNIKTKALTNKKLVSIHISEYKNIINDLRQEIEHLKLKLEKNVGSQESSEGCIPLPPPVNQQGKKQGVMCSCGRVEESAEIKKVKEQIFENFNERIQLRRALMEIEEQNAMNILEIRKKQGDVLLLKKNEQTEETTDEIKILHKTIQTLKLSTQKNLLKKEITNLQLMESMSSTKKIREEIPKRIRSKENRDFLQIIIKNHVLELQNIQLEINMQIQEKIIMDLKNITQAQKAVIDEKGLDIGLDQQIIENEDIELEIDEDSDGDEEIVEEDEDIETQLMLDRRVFQRNKSANKMPKEEDRKKQDNLPSLSKKKDRDATIEKGVANIQNNGSVVPKDPRDPKDNMLDLNLKGVNVRLNEKLPFAANPKDKKKK